MRIATKNVIQQMDAAERIKATIRRLDGRSDMTMNAKLEACPFCGSADVYVRLYNQPSVICRRCLSMGPAASRIDDGIENVDERSQEAAKLWNQRTHSADLAIAQAAREWITAKNHVSDLILQSPPSVSNINTAIGHEDAALSKLRAAVEKADLTPSIEQAPKPPAG